MNRLSFFGDIAVSGAPVTVDKNLHDGKSSFANLEGPYLGDNDPQAILKSGPHLAQGTGFRDLMKASVFSDPWFFSEANNHFSDFGEEGKVTSRFLVLPQKSLRPFTVELFDAGGNHLVEDSNSAVIAVLTTQEVYFGTGYFSESLGNLDSIPLMVRNLKSRGLKVVVFHHGGNELIPIPSPAEVGRYRRWVRHGADAVIVTHPHIPMPHETFEGSPIMYGLGNFIVDGLKWQSVHHLALHSWKISLDIGSELDFSISLLKQKKNEISQSPEVTLAPERERTLVEAEHSYAMDIVEDKDFHIEVFRAIAHRAYLDFVPRQIGLTFLTEMLRKIGLLGEVRRSRKLRGGFAPHLYDLFASEANRELYLTGFMEIQGSPQNVSKEARTAANRLLEIRPGYFERD